MAGNVPHPSTVPPGEGGYHSAAQHHQQQPASSSQTAEFFLSNYRLGKTLGIGSFGKVRCWCCRCALGERKEGQGLGRWRSGAASRGALRAYVLSAPLSVSLALVHVTRGYS